MARKFLYIVAILAVLIIATLFALRLWPGKLSEWALVPDHGYEQPAPVAANRYADPKMWISRPDRGPADPARWLPQGAPKDAAPVAAAVFFVHPTSYLEKAHWNAPLDDATARDLADTMVRGLASPFNQAMQLWAPRYRQATFGAFLSDKPEGLQALDLAYGDVAAAFDQFVASIPADQPIVLAGHSQGAYHLRRLLKDRIEGTPLIHRIAAVYAIGWPISLEHDLPLMGLPACTGPDQSGCVVSWLSYGEPADPGMTLAAYARRPALDGKSPGGSPFLCSNPLTGGVGGKAPASVNLGVLKPDKEMKTAALVPGGVPAECRTDGFLSVGEAPDLGPYVLPGNNYHIYDIPLFWANLRADFARRVQAWKPAR
ncbi:MAG: hypothetical protein JWQ16_1420 [Novosphingobium sp.]|nr:hypothetical protein [Novosphingobium sp.]